jgi:hypothetical protein
MKYKLGHNLVLKYEVIAFLLIYICSIKQQKSNI